MADVQPIQNPQPLQIALHLRNAANEIAKFDNLPQFNDNPVLQAIENLSNQVRTGTTALRGDMNTLRRDVNNQVTALRNEVTTLRNEVTTLRRDMTWGFASLRASIETT